MASSKQEITKPFSRMQNGLVEVQRWWPAYVKNDGIGGLTVSPTLYSTNFGPKTEADEGGRNDESNTPGVRVEVVGDDGEPMVGAYTLTISGSGTMNPRATLNYGGTTYAWMLVAPSAEGTGSTTVQTAYGTTAYGGADQSATAGSPSRLPLDYVGPYPVFQTIQEFAEMLDTYRHVATAGSAVADDNKPAWLPHGLIGRDGVSSAAALPSMDDDPRITSAEYDDQMAIRATVFMPMMLDNNQFDKRISGADVSFAWPENPLDSDWDGYKQQGITRYDSNPTGEDKNTIRFKEVGYSGDHLHGAVGAWSNYQNDSKTAGTTWSWKSTGGSVTDNIGFGNPDISLDTTAAIGPKYRMRMALACFLKDGTYTLNNGGDIIPYIYDPDRTIGGMNTDTLYSVWDGKKGYGTSQPIADDCSAQIYPMFDFVQGPVCPSAQGNNFDASVIELEHQWWPKIKNAEALYTTSVINPRQFLVRPNPKRAKILGVEKNASGQFILYTDANTTDGVTFVGGNGMPLYIHGLEGSLGSDAESASTRWDSQNTGGDDTSSDEWWAYGIENKIDHNGWWICRSVGASQTGSLGSLGTQTYQTIIINMSMSMWSSTATGFYAPTDAYLTQGRMGGFGGCGASLAKQRESMPYGVDNQCSNGEQTFVSSDLYQSMKGTGTGFFAGLSLPDSSAPIGASTDSTYPSRPTLDSPEQPDAAGQIVSATNFTARSITIRGDSDSRFATAPTVTSLGAGVLRIPPPIGWDLAGVYYGTGRGAPSTSGLHEKDYTIADNSAGTQTSLKGVNARWSARGIHIPFWTFIDEDGRHAWDYTKPGASGSEWLYGRNRPFPPQDRIGTRAAYSPSLFADAVDGGWVSGGNPLPATGDYLGSGVESTKYGLTEMGCSPVWLDMEMRAFIPVRDDRLVLIEFDNGVSYGKTGRHSMITQGGTENTLFGHGFYPIWDGVSPPDSGNLPAINPMSKVGALGNKMMGSAEPASGTTSVGSANLPTYTINRPAVWIWGAAGNLFTKDWTNDMESIFPVAGAGGNNGWGGLGNGFGYGSAGSITEGSHMLRTVFTEGGMNYILDGANVGTDPTSAQAIWGMTVKVADALAFDMDDEVTNEQGSKANPQRPNMNLSHADLQIDSLKLRQIPTPAMVPFTVDTMKQKPANVARYTTLEIEAENVKSSTGMNITATLLEPPSLLNGIEVEASTIISGFEDVDLAFVGGIGTMDLTGLPASAITNGFVIRFNFYIPDSTQTEYHPIDWDKTPIIRSWTVKYDIKPTASLSCIGNTFNGDTTPPIDSKVGNMVSFRATGTTTDSDRKISKVKFDFGDGSVTGWISFDDQTLSSTTYDASHVYTKAGTFTAVAYVKDDSGNESAASTAISVVVAEGLPVAVLRASPGRIYATNTITLDGSSSYIISSDPARTISDYVFTPGDGTAATTQSASSLTHTYNTAGEYTATLTVKDNASTPNTSTTASVVVEILATDTTVDLLAQLNTRPSAFSESNTATFGITPTLDGTYPEVSDTGQRSDEFVLTGSFLKGTATADITTMQGYLTNGTLLMIEWETTDWSGSSSVKRFTGRMTAFDFDREGGRHGETPYSATFIREQ